jgi:hypothetical protein
MAAAAAAEKRDEDGARRQGLLHIACHVIRRTSHVIRRALNPAFFSHTVSYKLASNEWQAQGTGACRACRTLLATSSQL